MSNLFEKKSEQTDAKSLFDKHYVKVIETGKVYEVTTIDYWFKKVWIYGDVDKIDFDKVTEATESDYNAQFEKKEKIEKLECEFDYKDEKINKLIDYLNLLSERINILESNIYKRVEKLEE